MGKTLPRRLALALAAVLVLGGCAPHAFHQEWRAGRYEAAAETFRRDSTLASDPRALYRMALLRLSPTMPLYDPPAARANLRSLLQLEPEPSLMREARFLLDVAGELGELQARVRALQGQIADLQGQIGELRGRVGTLQGQIDELQERLGDFRDQRVELRDLLERMREQLRALKAIDLGLPQPPPDTTSAR